MALNILLLLVAEVAAHLAVAALVVIAQQVDLY
jgi:hypothetical protein